MKHKLLPNISLSESLIDLLYYLIFGIFFFTIIFKVYSPDLIYLKLQPFFAFDTSFFDYYHTLHNSNIILLSEFFLQFLYYPVTGSIILSILLLLLSFIYRKIFKLRENKSLKGIEFIPALFILISLKTYASGLETLMLFIISGILFVGSQLLDKTKTWISIAYKIASLVAAFFVFDLLVAFSLMIVYVLDAVFISKTSKRYLHIPILLFVFAFLSWYYKGLQISKVIFYEASPANPRILISGFWKIIIFHAAAVFLIGLFSYLPKLTSFLLKIPLFIRRTWMFFVLAGLSAIFFQTLYVNNTRYNAEIEYHANRNNWKEVLNYKDLVGLNDRISRFLLNQALYHTGNMSQDLFIVPQEWGEHTLLLTMIFNRECTLQNSDLYFNIGFVKAAEYWALEAQTNEVYSPKIIIRLATCAILLQDFPVAKKYLEILHKSIIYKKTANDLYGYLNEDGASELKNDLFGERKIKYDIVFINNHHPDLDLIHILNKDKNNKMAFEYLMSYYLLNNNLGRFYKYLTLYVNNFGYKKLPKTYQEAMLLFYLSTNTPAEQYMSVIDKSVMNRFSEFNKTMIEYNMNLKRARKDLQKNFGDTYWYYLRYISPKVSGTKVKKKVI